jgi:hypothetical protein
MNPNPEKIRGFLVRMTETFGNQFITIGGWAVNAYACKGKSLDGGAMISFQTEGSLRDSYIVEKNPRMKKSQMLCEANCDIDLYVEHQHGLKVPFDEVQAYCQKKAGLVVPCAEHLLVLKLQAFKERRNSPKGNKDQEDMLQILAKVPFEHPEILERYLEEEDLEILLETTKNVPCSLRITSENAQAAKQLRNQAKRKTGQLLNACKEPSEKPNPYSGKDQNLAPNL